MDDELPPNFWPAPKKVKPRSRLSRTMPVAAIYGNEVLTEDGERLLLDELVPRLRSMPSTIFATQGDTELLAWFDNIFAGAYPTEWQWRTTPHERYNYKPRTSKRRRNYRVDTVVHFFGFKNHAFHRLIDPVSMYGYRLAKVYPTHKTALNGLLDWAITLRDFCAANNLDIRPTIGAISSQFLTDPRFYPHARRKVPAATNATVREHLPGNHYSLFVSPSQDRDYSVYYIDQRRAHHYHARELSFPHADHLYAYGNFRNLGSYYRSGVRPGFSGLYCVDVTAPRHGRYYSWLRGSGTLTHQFVYSNEIPHLLDMGYEILGVRAAWGSLRQDTGLNQFADWAYDTLDQYGDPAWLKPLLLATYGALACRPTWGDTVFKQASKGTDHTTFAGPRSLTGRKVKRPMKLEPGFVNVLHRGMIEAATRSESIGLAQWLEAKHQRILQIYADAVVVEINEDLPLPALPQPWEVKRTLNHYQPINRQAFIADGMTRLPGVSGTELREYQQKRTVLEQV